MSAIVVRRTSWFKVRCVASLLGTILCISFDVPSGRAGADEDSIRFVNSSLDSVSLQRLRHQLAGSLRARVRSLGAEYEIGYPVAHPESLGFDSISSREQPIESRPTLTWQSISSIRIPKRRTLEGALIGGVLLGGTTLVIGFATQCHGQAEPFQVRVCGDHSDSDVLVAGLIASAVGGALGALIGRASTKWSAVYVPASRLPDSNVLTVTLENSPTLKAVGGEPWAQDMIKFELLNGEYRYVAASRVQAIIDSKGRDRTQEVIVHRKRVTMW